MAAGTANRMGSGPKKPMTERLVRRIYYKYFSRNLLYELQTRARNQSADYVEANMPDATIYEAHAGILEDGVEMAPDEGLILEFGVASGNTLSIIANAAGSGREVHGFDSFEGLPGDWGGHVERKGAFARNGDLPSVPSNARLHVGWFNQTLGPFLAENEGPAAFVHIDCDIYSSTVDILEGLRPRLVEGTVILFDEYFNYPGWRNHEYKAWQEFVAETGIEYDYKGFTAHDGRVLVLITKV